MKKTMIAVAFAVASVPMMFAAQTAPAANPPASGSKTEAPKARKHTKKGVKKATPKKDAGSTTGSPASK